ncbi:hypothetical protein TSMEX_009466, partial [Taenia solium]
RYQAGVIYICGMTPYKLSRRNNRTPLKQPKSPSSTVPFGVSQSRVFLMLLRSILAAFVPEFECATGIWAVTLANETAFLGLVKVQAIT